MSNLNIIYCGCNKIIRSTGWYKEFWSGAAKFWSFNRFNLDVVNLGSGAGVYSFNYSKISVKGENWAVGPQSLVHDYNILRNYFSFIKPNGVVIITISPFSSLISSYTKDHNLKYYTFLHPATILNFDEEERVKALKMKLNPLREYPLLCIKKALTYYLRKAKRSMIPQRTIDLTTSANEMIALWKRQFGIQDLSAPLSSKHLNEQKSRHQTLTEMVEFCKERDLKPVIVIPPMHKALSGKFPVEFQRNYIDPLLENIDVPIYNYMYNNQYSDDKYFRTALFLSEKGASKFTTEFINQLQEDKILNMNN